MEEIGNMGREEILETGKIVGSSESGIGEK